MSRYGVEVEPIPHGANLTLIVEGFATTAPLTNDQVVRLIRALREAVPELRSAPIRVARCLDCGCLPGRTHLDGCDMARCVATGEQRATCEHRRKMGYSSPEEHDCGHDVWQGQQ